MKKHDADDAPEITAEWLAGARKISPAERKAPGRTVIVSAKAGVVSAKVVRGGSRPGAGRKSTGHVQVMIRVTPRVRDALRRRAKRDHATLGQVVTELLAA